MLPHFHNSGTHAIIVVLYVVAFFGSLHLLAISKPDSNLARAWVGLGF